MCGIIGSVNKPISEQLLLKLGHRGPDHHAVYTSQVMDNTVSLGHTRLSIVDLSDNGNQPMVSDDGNYCLVFNGEIYNHMQVRRSLKNKVYKGHADSETLLYFMIEKGIDHLSELNGIYAFVFFDKLKARIICARDPFGVKPLYYTSTGRTFVCASEIRGLNLDAQRNINRDALNLLLQLRYVPSPFTLLKDVYKLRPGHYLTVEMGNGQISVATCPIKINFFNTVTDHRPQFRGSFDDAVAGYGRHITDAVSRQLMGDVDMGIFLSGGVDSAIIAGLMSKLSAKKHIKAFTVGFDSDYDVNEAAYAAETAAYFGLEHQTVRMNADDFYSTLCRCSKIVEEPLATTSMVPMYYLSQLASKSVKVVLTGQGADEPLGGYKKYQGELLRSAYPHMLFSALHRLAHLSGIKKESVLRAADSLYVKDDVSRFVKIATLFTPDEIRALTGVFDEHLAKDEIDYFYELIKLPSDSPVEKLMAVDTFMNLADDLLLYTDKVTMNFSLECRVPMLDFRLVDFIQSLPQSYKLRRGHSKIVHKAFAERFLPPSIINRRKLAFQSPTDLWFRRDASMLQSLLTTGPIADVLDKNAIATVIGRHCKGYNYEKQIFLLMSLNSWLQQ